MLEPEFRGSTGLGSKHFRAGWKQWGLAMQDDLADATLMGLIRHPDIFRCGVNWLGVTDIDLMSAIDWSDMGDEWRAHGMPALVGDRKKDAAQLAATSPLELAARLSQPLLLAYGGADRRMPIKHGTELRDALKAHNPNVEWVVDPDEGHRWMLETTRVDFWGRVERSLERHLQRTL